MWINIGELRETFSLMVVWNTFIQHFFPGFFWPIILLCLVLVPYLVYLRILSDLCTHLCFKMVLVKRPMGRLTSLLFLTSKETFCTIIVRKFALEWEMCIFFIFHMGGLSFSSLLLLFYLEASVHEDKLQLFRLVPIYPVSNGLHQVYNFCSHQNTKNDSHSKMSKLNLR